MSACAAAVLVDPLKISSANRLFESVYGLVYEILVSLPKSKKTLRNFLIAFYDTAKFVSLDDVEDKGDIEGSYFLSGYRGRDAVFYPFQPADVVEVGFFLETVAEWVVVLNHLEQLAVVFEEEFVECEFYDFEFYENIIIVKERIEEFIASTF